ncbi:MAG: filamentous hemagglutinin N-terminal domain-containing protein, partial [Cyanobacteria bacterium J06560_2]
TVESDRTQVTPLENNTYTITGGAVRGSERDVLFHSFDSFSLEAGEFANFDTLSSIETSSVETVLGRVTGGLSSSIDGTITTADGVSLFLINPRGISFGPNSTLDVGGSFIASTAESIVLADGNEFSATTPQAVPLLSISQPIGLSIGQRSGSVENSSINTGGLSVLPDNLIALIGNSVVSFGGLINASQSQIGLLSLAPGSFVGLEETANDSTSWVIDDDSLRNQPLSDIQLSAAQLYTTDFGEDRLSGSVRLLGRNIYIGDGTQIYAYNRAASEGGNLTVSATESFTLEGGVLLATSTFGDGDSGEILIDVPNGTVEFLEGSAIRGDVVPFGEPASGNAGTLTINAENLILRDDSLLSTSTFSEGNAGNLNLNVSGGTVELFDKSRIVAQSEADATGSAGTLSVNSENLFIRGGSELSTTALGDGLGGDLLVNSENVLITGAFEETSLSKLTSTTEGVQNAGEIQINARTLRVENGGLIIAATYGSGDGGRISLDVADSVTVTGQFETVPSRIFSSTGDPLSPDPLSITGNAGALDIKTRRLMVENGARIFVSTDGPGQGGSLTVEADDIVLSGQGSRPSGLFARTESSGDSGRLTLTTNTLLIRDGAQVTVSTDEDAVIGDLEADELSIAPATTLGTVRDANITARSITLNNGQITAESVAGDGGRLNFNVQDYILLGNNSLISATAGTENAGGDGGNVTINMPNGLILALPNENSDIIANAFSGTGGNIDITARSIVGLDARSALGDNLSNDIDASSELGRSGTLSINNLEPDPVQNNPELPDNTADPYPVAQRCLADSQGRSAFVVTGQGGAPPSPTDIIRNESISLADLDRRSAERSAQASPIQASPTLIEAKGWQRDGAGNVVLLEPDVAQASVQTASRHHSSCVQQS